jgi:membrane protein implicated in regulation of membrane protease activity
MALEVLAPGVFLFWLGLAALLVGLISFAVAVSWQIQLVMFAIFAAAAVPVWRRLARPKLDASTSPFLNKRSEALLGREFTLEKPIIDGNGTVRLPPPWWGRVARRRAARRVRGISPRVNLLLLNSRKQPLIRRFAPPSPTGGEGRLERAAASRFYLFHLSANRCSGMNVSHSSRPSAVNP